MQINIDDKMLDKLIQQSLLWHYNLYLEDVSLEDRDEMIKALKWVHNYYAPFNEYL